MKNNLDLTNMNFMRGLKHTKGPWTTDSSSEVDLVRIIGPENNGLALTCNEHASLISAAPEMLDVLDLIHAELILNGEYKDEELFTQIEAVLKKARG